MDEEHTINAMPHTFSWTTVVLIAGWWLVHPLCLFAYSRVSGNGVFLDRYLSVALPGAVLAAVYTAGLILPARRWKQAAFLLGMGVVLLMGQWSVAWPRHDVSDWRSAAGQLRVLAIDPDTPVICPSPFLEARPPFWSPEYQLPGYFYAHFDAYPIPGKPVLLPFETGPEAFQYMTSFVQGPLYLRERFVIYGWNQNVRPWRDWFMERPELAGWRQTTFDQFGDVWVVLFEHGSDTASVSDR